MSVSRRVRTTAIASVVAASSVLGLAASASAASGPTTHRTYKAATVNWYANGDAVKVRDNKADGWYPRVWVKDLTTKKSYGYAFNRKGAGTWSKKVSFHKIPENHRVSLRLQMVKPGKDGYIKAYNNHYKAFRTHS